MRSLLAPLIFTTWGVCVLGALDSTVIFFLPFAVDVGVVYISSRHPHLAWVYAIAVSATSVIGTAVSFYMGKRIGEAGLDRFVSERKLQGVLRRAKKKGAVAIGLLELIPPPFPFTAFILVAGALEVNATRFFITVFFTRLLRFEVEAFLGARFGGYVIRLIQSPTVRMIGEFFTVAIFIGCAISVYTLVRNMKKKPGAVKEKAA